MDSFLNGYKLSVCDTLIGFNTFLGRVYQSRDEVVTDNMDVGDLYKWLTGKGGVLNIPNKALEVFLIDLRRDCSDSSYFLKRLMDLSTTDEFRNLFPPVDWSSEFSSDRFSSWGSPILVGKPDKDNFKRKSKPRLYKPVMDYDICKSHEELLHYIHYAISQTDNLDAPRIIALLGGSGSGKNFITNQLLPYYISKHIKGNLYVTVINGSNEDSQSKIFFKESAIDSDKIIVGKLAEAIMCSNENTNKDDFYLVIYNEYTRTPLTAIDEALSFLGGFNEVYQIGNRDFYRKPNLGIVMNGNLGQVGVGKGVVMSEALNSRIERIYESPFANKDRKGEFLESLVYYGILMNDDRILSYIKKYGENAEIALKYLLDYSSMSSNLTLDCRYIAKMVKTSMVTPVDESINDRMKAIKELYKSYGK